MLALEPRRFSLPLRIAAAVMAAGFTFAVLDALPYYPPGWQLLLTLAVGVLWLLRPATGLLLTLLVYLLPIAYSSITLAMLYVPSMLLIGATGPYGFLVLAVTTTVLLMPEFTRFLLVAPLAAGFLGARRGAFLAVLACFWAQIVALLTGVAQIGLLVTGVTTPPLVSLRSTPLNSLLDFSWMKAPGATPMDGANPLIVMFNPGLFSELFTPFVERPFLLAQIALWATAAGAVGAILAKPQSPGWRARLAAAGSGALILGIGYLVLTALLAPGQVLPKTVGTGVLFSAVLVLLASPVLEMVPSALRPKAEEPEPPAEMTSRAEVPKDDWNELAGVDDIKAELRDAIESQFNPKVRSSLLKMSIRPTRGILLFGPPGTGKTKLARIVAREAGAALFAVSGTEFTTKWFGESEANLRRIFEEARRNRPSVLFFDELEAFLPKRTELSRSDAPEKGIVATFLAYTDGVGDMDGVLLVGATNHPDLIDPAALRPGRFDKIIYISPPGREARYAILGRYLQGKPLAPDVDLDKLAGRLERFTGADIQAVCAEATKWAFRRGGGAPTPITLSDLERAIGGTKPSVTIKMLHEYEAIADQYGRRAEKVEAEDVVARPILRWSDVAGLDSVKEALRDAIEMPLAHPELFREYGVKPSTGVLLFGPPGCGKTFLAKVVASEAKAHFLHVKGPELLQQVIGGSELRLRDVFVRARENTPCVLFFDEIDALAGARGTAEASGTKILTQFLTEMDGVEELKGVIVVAATNRPDTLDAALLRPGRFDRLLYVPPPDRAARLALLKKELAGKPTSGDVDCERLADLTDGYSAADITAICNMAAMSAAKEVLHTGERQPIAMQRLQEQVERTPRSLSPSQLAAYEALRDQLQR